LDVRLKLERSVSAHFFLGRSKRPASADQRILLHAIDGGCTVSGCDEPAYNSEVDHLVDWSPDGATGIDPLTLICQTATSPQARPTRNGKRGAATTKSH
jgi:hypothetical protein